MQCPAEVNVAVVQEGVPLHSGEPTWQAEIYVPQGGSLALNHSGRVRTMCIRGPSRSSHEQAEVDAKRLNEAALDGPRAVRTIANQMQSIKKRTIANQMQRTTKGHDLD